MSEMSEDIEYLKNKYFQGMETLGAGMDEVELLKLRVRWLEDNFFEMLRLINE